MDKQSKIKDIWNKLTDNRDDTYRTKVKMGIAGLVLGSFALVFGYNQVKEDATIRSLPDAKASESTYNEQRTLLNTAYILAQKRYYEKSDSLNRKYLHDLDSIIKKHKESP